MISRRKVRVLVASWAALAACAETAAREFTAEQATT
jgi:curli biogenesis system outer membrane secretion channel CsgG